MSFIPNEFNPYGHDTVNHTNVVPIQQTNPNLRTQGSNMVRSTLVTPAFASYHGSQVLSSSLTINNSRVAHQQMRSNMVSTMRMPCMPPSSSVVVSTFSKVCIMTQTISNRYHAIVPTNNLVTVLNGTERVNRVMTSDSTIRNSTFHPPAFIVNQPRIIIPKPIDFVFSQQDSASLQHFNPSSLSTQQHQEPYVPNHGRPLKKIRRPTGFLEETNDYIHYEEGPKCNCLVDTSQMLDAHSRFVHRMIETDEEKNKRLSARNKKRSRDAESSGINGNSHMNKPEDRVA